MICPNNYVYTAISPKFYVSNHLRNLQDD